MVILLDLGAPVESANLPPRDDRHLETVTLIVAPRESPPAGRTALPNEPLNDDGLITWEDAEWQ